MTALSACANTTTNSARLAPAPYPTQTVALQTAIAPASDALNRVANALDVNVRQIKAGPRPGAGLLASSDIAPRTVLISHRLQCVPFARERSGVAIRGNANTWWAQAAGSFVRTKEPAIGSVVVMNTRRGHVGVVTKIVDSRTVIIDHSNWLSSGQIYLDQPMMDVSANNDWSKVVVWHPNLGKYGKRALTVSGFIADVPARGNNTVYASLADVPASLAGNVQYAQAVVSNKTTRVKTKAAPVEAPVLVAAAKTRTIEAAPVVLAEAKPVYVNAKVPNAKPANLEAPMLVAAVDTKVVPAAKPALDTTVVADAKPVYVDMIVPGAKPSGLGNTMLVASADKAVYVDTIVPGAKPKTLDATAVAVVGKGETGSTKTTDMAFIPVVKPTSVATFR